MPKEKCLFRFSNWYDVVDRELVKWLAHFEAVNVPAAIIRVEGKSREGISLWRWGVPHGKVDAMKYQKTFIVVSEVNDFSNYIPKEVRRDPNQ